MFISHNYLLLLVYLVYVVIDGSTFASCGWCCQTEAGDNQWTNDACGDKEDVENVGCDSDEDGENDGFLVEVANGKNQKKNGDKPLQTAGKCVTYDDIAGTLNHFWGSFCVP